jgi:3-deoxy-D-manno-octulosonic-acid transferase
VQDESYAARFKALGLPAERCEITGSMKWDAATIEDRVEGAHALAAELGIDFSKPLVVAGSTGPGEEALLHRACPPGVQLLCAPRKPERFDEATAAMGPGAVRRTALKAQGRPAAKGTERFELDTIGELRRAYALATVVVVGRSLGSQ